MSSKVIESGDTINLTASGVIKASRCALMGFYVNSTSGGTLVLKDGGSGGTALGGTISPSVGFHAYPAEFSASAYATITGTMDVTFFYA